MGAEFKNVIPYISDIERGYVNSVSDYGGETKFGISKRSFPLVNISQLTFDDACSLYKEHFWDFYQLGNIQDQNVANLVFLLLINMNPFNAVKIIQSAINICGKGLFSIIVDGVLGSKSFTGLNTLPPLWLCDRIRLESCRYYLKQTDLDEKQISNFRGWIRRALS